MPDWTSPEVVTLGESMALLMGHPGQPLRSVKAFSRSIAGAESNVAIGLARLGHRSGWIGRLGDDPLGLGILDTLRSENVDVSRARIDPDAPTGVLIRDQHAERRIRVLYYRSDSAGSRLSEDDVDSTYIADARILHLTGITPALSDTSMKAARHAMHIARDHGVTVSFDPNLRLRLWDAEQAAAALAPFFDQADILHVGLYEGQLLSGASGKSAVARWFLDQGARLVVIKLGAAGSWATDGRDTWTADPFPVSVVDPIGAGDAFVAGFLSSWLHGADLSSCLRTGNAAGAMAVQYPGDVEGLPYRVDLEALLEEKDEADR